MDQISSLPLTHATFDPIERDLAEIDAAIGMVAAGIATRVRLVGLARPDVAAAVALARSQAACLGFEVDSGPDGISTVTVGPIAVRRSV